MSNLPQSNVFDLKSLLPSYHEIRLPSNGKYSSQIPALINVRGMTIKELKHLTAAGRVDKAVFDNCISSCIKESIDLSSLILEDYNFIVYNVRIFTSGTKAMGAKTCDNPGCRTPFNFEYDAAECSLVDYAEDILPQTVSISLPRFKTEHNLNIMLEVKRLTRKNAIEIDKSIRKSLEDAAKLGQSSKVFPLIEYLKAFIVSIEGFPIPVPKEQLLDILTTEEAEKISSAFGTETIGIKGETHPVCPSCGQENSYTIPYTDLFFQ